MDAIVQVIDSAISARDPYTVIHHQRVTQISMPLAEEMGLEPKRLNCLKMAARLHDFGKISIPIGILCKSGKLSVQEMALIKTHPITGTEMLKPLKLPTCTFLTIMQHHERLDGTGYPFGLTEKDILLEARILAVADVVEAMSSHRPYRPSLGIDNALEELWQNKGKLYDPAVVEAFSRLHSAFTWDTSFALLQRAV
ncbi:MAG: HD-GYP domain-containing protein [Desulfobaccales bacterium]|jgi:HD-GYP domain-containing protein (c-di-GMP phosphodiesterase class II)